MNTNSTYLLQKLDANCSDCKFMDRDIVETKLWKGYWEHIAYMDFIRDRMKSFKVAGELIHGSPVRPSVTPDTIRQGQHYIKKARKVQFQFDSSGLISYGICLNRKAKWGQPVTFISGTMQLETQECFKHRKDE